MMEVETHERHGDIGDIGDRLSERPPYSDHVTLLDLLIPLAQQKWLIVKVAIGIAVLSVAISLSLPNEYTAEAKILPPQQAQSSLGTIMGQLGQVGGLAALAGKDFGIKNPADLYVGVLRSHSVSDAIINQFRLQSYYRDRTMTDTRRDLAKHTQFEAGKDGLITISVEHRDPQRAAEIANSFVDQLHEANKRLAISEASQRRLFFEQQVNDEKTELADAEVRLKKTQESTGLIRLDSQAEAIIRSVAALKAELTGREVQLQAMKSFATDQNPDFVRLQQEIMALRSQLARAERSENVGAGNLEVPTGKLPEAGLEYVRRYREVKYHESLFEVLAREYEAARIDEGRNAPIIQVLDRAAAPDKRSGPARLLLVLLSTVLGFIATCFFVWCGAAYRRLANDPAKLQKLTILKDSLFTKRARAI